MIDRVQQWLCAFNRDESGVVTIEFVLVFPMFFAFFLMTYEQGIISLRNMMLEHGVDMAVREVRIGAMPVPTSALLKESICEHAQIIPDCEDRTAVEMIVQDVSAGESGINVPGDVSCNDLSVTTQASVAFTNGGNNDVVFLRVCTRVDPLMPTTFMRAASIGKAIVDNNTDAASSGTFALVATAAFVVEPFNDED